MRTLNQVRQCQIERQSSPVRGAFEAVRWELLDVRGSGDRGVAHFRMAGTLESVTVEQTIWQAVKLRDGKLMWWAFYRDAGEALEAVGL